MVMIHCGSADKDVLMSGKRRHRKVATQVPIRALARATARQMGSCCMVAFSFNVGGGYAMDGGGFWST